MAFAGHEVTQFEVELARRLAETDGPVAALDPRVEPRVYERDGFAVILWTLWGAISRSDRLGRGIDWIASAEGAAPMVYRSSDGGRTWEASDPLSLPSEFMQLADAPELSPGEVRAFEGTLLLPVATAAAQHVYRSTDGGATWAPIVSIEVGGAALALVSPTRWLLVGPESQETLDAGVSWHAFATDYSQAAPIAPQVSFESEEAGYATVRGTLQRTSDGGVHWTPIATPGTAPGM